MPRNASSRSKRGQRSQQQLARKETANMRAAEQDRNSKAASKQAKTPKSKSKKGIPSSSIIEHNRKIELCRKYANASCTFGDPCALAHGLDDIKRKTLRQLEEKGRIADASKYQACLCQERNRFARAGEADRKEGPKLVKHLLAGKMGLGTRRSR